MSQTFNFPSLPPSFTNRTTTTPALAPLAGFLPYVDDEDQNGSAAASSSAGRKRQSPARYNHAIWDQIGLLHWVKRNVHAFGGDPASVTLLAADNRGSLCVQLLCVSPPAKGLFGRAILLQRQRACTADSNKESPTQMDLGQLIAEQNYQKNAEMRRRLSNQLVEIVLDLNSTLAAATRQPVNAYELMLEADIGQLARIDRELKRKSPRKLLLLLEEPSLDDSLLFPHLRPLIDHMKGGSANQLVGSLRSELNYCAYIRRIYQAARAADPTSNLLEADPLQLVPLAARNSSGGQQHSNGTIRRLSNGAGGWHREPAAVGEADRGGARSQLRSMAVQYFNHLNYLSHLNRILLASSQAASRLAVFEPADIADADDDELDNSDRKQDRATGKRAAVASLGRNGRAASSELQSMEDTNQLAGLLAAVDIVFGYISCSDSSNSTSQLDDKNYYYQASQTKTQTTSESSNFSRLAESLLSWASSNSSDGSSTVDNNLLAWFKWIDFHSILGAAGQQQQQAWMNTHYCGFSALLPSSSSLNETTSTPRGLRNSFIFMLNEAAGDESPTTDWSLLHRTLQNAGKTVQSGLRSFIKYGDVDRDPGGANSWPSYDTLSRQFEPVRLEESRYASLKNQMRVQLDLVPYLEDDLGAALAATKNGDNLKSPLYDLHNCLIELELAKQAHAGLGNNRKWCLSSLLARLRGLTRRYAARDLKPLISSLGATSVQNANPNQMWEFGPEKGSGTSLITTRNLVNQLSDMEDVAAASDEHDQHSLIVTNGTTSSGLTGRQGAAAAGGSALAISNGTGSALLKRLVGSLAFKGTTAGRALTIVVVAGLVIFLVNLIIVLVMALRSSSRQRPRPAQGGATPNKVSDSPEESPSVLLAGKSILMLKQHSAGGQLSNGNDRSLDDHCSSSLPNNNNSNSTTMKLASSLRKGPSDRRRQSDADKQTTIPQTTRATKQLKFNLADEQNEPHLEQTSPASGADMFQQQQQMIELTNLMMSRGDEDELGQSEQVLSASPLLDASQYLLAETRHHHHRHHHHQSHSDECAMHHQHAFHDLPDDQYHVVTAPAAPARTQHPAIQSPFNPASSLTSNSNATGTNSSSTFRQSSASLRLIKAPDEPHHHQHQHQQFQGVQFCSSLSPNSSTTLSVTPNQQTESSSVCPAQHQFMADLAPYHYHHHRHQAHQHADAFEPILVGEQMSDPERLVQTLRRQHKFPPGMPNGPNHNQDWPQQ